MTNAQEAAAFWGIAENQAFSTLERLRAALQALEFFGNAYEEKE